MSTRGAYRRVEPVRAKISRVKVTGVWRVGPGRVRRHGRSRGSGRVGRGVFKSHLSGRIGSTNFQISRVDSGRFGRISKSRGRDGSGHLTRPTRPARFDMTRENSWKKLGTPVEPPKSCLKCGESGVKSLMFEMSRSGQASLDEKCRR